jgi:crotonobetainyl-CoA:carnitine CoA-transferase CaiB-like acyl-CoA transferase
MGQEALTGEGAAADAGKASSWAIYDPFQTADGKTLSLSASPVTTTGAASAPVSGWMELLADTALKTNPQRAVARANHADRRREVRCAYPR